MNGGLKITLARPELNFRLQILKFWSRLQMPRIFGRSVGYIVINFHHFPCVFYIVAWACISFFRELSFFNFCTLFTIQKSYQKQINYC